MLPKVKSESINKNVNNFVCNRFFTLSVLFYLANIRDIHYHKENKTNGGKQIEFSAERNQFEKKSKVGINEMFSNC